MMDVMTKMVKSGAFPNGVLGRWITMTADTIQEPLGFTLFAVTLII